MFINWSVQVFVNSKRSESFLTGRQVAFAEGRKVHALQGGVGELQGEDKALRSEENLNRY